MYRIIADTHTHTIATDHAFSTLLENLDYARRAGMQAIAMTEHCPALADSPIGWHIGAVANLPQYVEDMMVLSGAELNLLDADGGVDIDEHTLTRLQWVIVSMHNPVYPVNQSVEINTAAWIAAAENPLIDCIGHCGDSHFNFDYETVIPLFGQYGKAVEINNHSFEVRAGSTQNCTKIALLCKKYGVPIVVSSDAHFALSVGKFPLALQMLDEIEFPEQLILNTDLKRLCDFINAKPHKTNKVTRRE